MRTAEQVVVVKLIDFGLASRNPKPRKPSGTALYSAPEKFRYQSSTDPWTGNIDVWSLGLVGLDLLGALSQQPQRVDKAVAWELDGPYADGWQGDIQVQLKDFLKSHILSSTHPMLIATLSTMLEVDPKQRVSAREALEYLHKNSELGFDLPLGMDSGE